MRGCGRSLRRSETILDSFEVFEIPFALSGPANRRDPRVPLPHTPRNPPFVEEAMCRIIPIVGLKLTSVMYAKEGRT